MSLLFDTGKYWHIANEHELINNICIKLAIFWWITSYAFQVHKNVLKNDQYFYRLPNVGGTKTNSKDIGFCLNLCSRFIEDFVHVKSETAPGL